jgi:mRNA interferase RelE/StbE
MNETYVLVLEDDAVDYLNRLDKTIARRIRNRLDWLAANAKAIKHDGLTGQFSGRYRLRTGDYRIIYRLDHGERLIIVETIGHRRNVYDD